MVQIPASRLVRVGSTNPAKVEAVRLVFEDWLPGCHTEARSVASGVHEQPLGDRETKAGAETRARNAWLPEAWSVGMEGGVEIEEETVMLVNWCAVISPGGLTSVSRGIAFPLPPAVRAAVARRDELGRVMMDLTGIHDLEQRSGAVGYLTQGRVSRCQLWQQALWGALIPFLSPALFPEDGMKPTS